MKINSEFNTNNDNNIYSSNNSKLANTTNISTQKVESQVITNLSSIIEQSVNETSKESLKKELIENYSLRNIYQSKISKLKAHINIYESLENVTDSETKNIILEKILSEGSTFNYSEKESIKKTFLEDSTNKNELKTDLRNLNLGLKETLKKINSLEVKLKEKDQNTAIFDAMLINNQIEKNGFDKTKEILNNDQNNIIY